MPDQSFNEWWRTHKDDLMQDENAGLREIAESAWDAAMEAANQKLDAFVELTDQTRSAQRAYFKDRTGSSLTAAKKLEKQVDQAIAEHKQGVSKVETVQLSFPENGGGRPKLLTGYQLTFFGENNNGHSE